MFLPQHWKTNGRAHLTIELSSHLFIIFLPGSCIDDNAFITVELLPKHFFAGLKSS